jgi:hypothetical protein
MNKLFLQICDLSSISDIKSLASRFSKKNVPLHVLVIKSSIILSVDCVWILFYFKKLQLIISFLQYKYNFWCDIFYNLANLFSSITTNIGVIFCIKVNNAGLIEPNRVTTSEGWVFLVYCGNNFFANSTCSGRFIAAIWQYFVLNCIS